MPNKPKPRTRQNLGEQGMGVRRGLTNFGNAISDIQMPRFGPAKKRVGSKHPARVGRRK